MTTDTNYQLDLYGLSARLPFKPPVGMSRSAIPPQRGATFAVAHQRVSADAIWVETTDGVMIRVSRSAIDLRPNLRYGAAPISTVLEIDNHYFAVSGTTVRYQSVDPAATIDIYYNTLLAILLAHNEMVALHGFVADLATGHRVAILGQSGAGKSTLGRQLLHQGATLVSDDLVALDPQARCHPGPPFYRVVNREEGATLDGGGKFRMAVDNVNIQPRPIDVFVVLEEDTVDGSPTGTAALDRVLAHPYLPVAALPSELMMRLQILTSAMQTAGCLCIKRRSLPPEEMAFEVERHCRQIQDRHASNRTYS